MASSIGDSFWFKHVIVQPTTYCNLNCGYCYLHGHNKRNLMHPSVSLQIAQSIKRSGRKIRVIWHGGEPLTIGIGHFEKLVLPFEDGRREGFIRHSIQTNGTLIDRNWCSFFRRYDFSIGLSIDGDKDMNATRRTRSGKPAFEKIMKGVNELKRQAVPFSIIAVVSDQNIQRPDELYANLVALGPRTIGFNVEEREGNNRAHTSVDDGMAYLFWRQLFRAWRNNPVVPIREINNALEWISATLDGRVRRQTGPRDLWPTIAYNGDVFLIAPEFMAVNSTEASEFRVGNVCCDKLEELVTNAGSLWFVKAFEEGVDQCEQECAYFRYCR